MIKRGEEILDTASLTTRSVLSDDAGVVEYAKRTGQKGWILSGGYYPVNRLNNIVTKMFTFQVF